MKHTHIHTLRHTPLSLNLRTLIVRVSKWALYSFHTDPAPVIISLQSHYCPVSKPGTRADNAFVVEVTLIDDDDDDDELMLNVLRCHLTY